MNFYSYEGPVLEFDRVVDHKWKATTYAQSEAKARSNLTYRYKKENHKAPHCKITLTGKIKQVE